MPLQNKTKKETTLETPGKRDNGQYTIYNSARAASNRGNKLSHCTLVKCYIIHHELNDNHSFCYVNTTTGRYKIFTIITLRNRQHCHTMSVVRKTARRRLCNTMKRGGTIEITNMQLSIKKKLHRTESHSTTSILTSELTTKNQGCASEPNIYIDLAPLRVNLAVALTPPRCA